MSRRLGRIVFGVIVFGLFAGGSAFAQDVIVSTGPTSELLLGVDGIDFARIFTAKGGFKPGEIALGGDGRLYICDSSSSEIFRFDPADPDAGLETIYDRNSATSPNDPEQPKGCTVAGDDLLFLSRNGRGGNAKTGVWSIQDVTSNAGEPILLLGLDAVGGVSGQGLAVNFDGRAFFTFGNEVWVATPQPGAGRIDDASDFEIWGNTAGEGFGIATKGVLEPGTATLQTQVFVATKFSGVVEVLREVGGVGDSSGCASIDVAGLPTSLEFDGAGDLWLTSAEQSSGRRGSVYEVDDPVCGLAPFIPALRDDGLSAAVGIAVTPSGSDPITFNMDDFVDGKSATANMCNSLFNLDQVTAVCQDEWTISCRLLPQAEFETRTGFPIGSPAGGATVEQDFSLSSCADFPGAAGNCAEIRITQNTAAGQCTEEDIIDILANWQFFSLTPLQHPGLLYSPGDFPVDPMTGDPLPENSPFAENILVDYDPLPVPSDPVDPRATGSRDGWGSGLLVVDNAPNRPPTAVLSAVLEVAQCSQPVTLDGLASFDGDWNDDHADFITEYVFKVDGDEVAFDASRDTNAWQRVLGASDVGTGAHTAELIVKDEGWVPDTNLSSDPATVSFTISAGSAPVIENFRLKDLGHPQVNVDGAGTGATMWPPNHEMVPFEVMYDLIEECESDCEIIAVSSDPENGTGDGDAFPDVQITGDATLNLRSERTESGTGRTYTVTLRCIDLVGNVTVSDPISVFVPSNQ